MKTRELKNQLGKIPKEKATKQTHTHKERRKTAVHGWMAYIVCMNVWYFFCAMQTNEKKKKEVIIKLNILCVHKTMNMVCVCVSVCAQFPNVHYTTLSVHKFIFCPALPHVSTRTRNSVPPQQELSKKDVHKKKELNFS